MPLAQSAEQAGVALERLAERLAGVRDAAKSAGSTMSARRGLEAQLVDLVDRGQAPALIDALRRKLR